MPRVEFTQPNALHADFILYSPCRVDSHVLYTNVAYDAPQLFADLSLTGIR